MGRMLGGMLRTRFDPRRLRTATAVLAVVAVTSLVVPGIATPGLGSTSVSPTTGIAGPVETNLTSTAVDLGTLGGKRSEAAAVDGPIVVGWSTTTPRSNERHAFAYDLAAAESVMIDLGTLLGRSEAEAVDGTVVVGVDSDPGNEMTFRAFAYDLAAAEPEMIDLGTLGGGYASARDVEGTIVTGMSETASGEMHAFVYDLAAAEPAMRDLGTLGGGYSYGVAVDGSVVVGEAATASGETHAFAYDLAAAEPIMRDLGTLGGPSYAVRVDGAVAVGNSHPGGKLHAFAYDLAAAEPAMQDLGTLGGPDSWARDVDGTTVVGSSDTASGKSRAFAYDLAAADPAMRDLGTVKGATTSQVGATAIDGDLVIGGWSIGGWVTGQLGSSPHSFVYDLGADSPSMLDLGTGTAATIAEDVDGDVVAGHTVTKAGKHATAWVLRETTRPMIAFQRFERRVKEGVGRATIRVTRQGRTDRAVTVRYRTRGATAKAGEDFVATSGKLRFPRGVTRRSFTVKILNDQLREKDEYLLLTLSSPSSPALLGSPNWSQLRIKYNDR